MDEFLSNFTIDKLPEAKLEQFIKLVTRFFKDAGNLDMDELCEQIEKFQITPSSSQINQNSLIIEMKELKTIMFSDNNFKPSLEMSIKALLNLLKLQINTTKRPADYKDIIISISEICEFLEVTEKHIESTNIENSVTAFLSSLMQVLGRGNTLFELEQASMRSLTLKVLEMFIKVDFARASMLYELSIGLEEFHKFILKFSEPRELFSAPCCIDNLMMNLSLLKKILMYNVQQCEVSPAKVKKSKDSAKENMKTIFTEIMPILPRIVKKLAQDCLNLVM